MPASGTGSVRNSESGVLWALVIGAISAAAMGFAVARHQRPDR